VSKFLTSLRHAIFFRLTFLEKEVQRLRDEHEVLIERHNSEIRLLMDTLLAANGLPRMTPSLPQPLPSTKGRMLPSQWKRKMEAASEPAVGSENWPERKRANEEKAKAAAAGS
jgi:hypothetical protein